MNHSKKAISTVLCGVVAAGVVGGASPALGQEASDTPALLEIIVTAQKRSEKLQDVPISVTALSGSELAEANISAQTALPALTPNLYVTFNSDFIAAYIRGIGTQYANPGLDPSVGVYLDDQYFPRASAGMFEFADTERVEVLKGPQGTLYGRNTVGGAIRIITAEPSQKFSAKANITTGRFNRLKGDAVINGGITDTLSGRLAYTYDSADGFVDNINPAFPSLGSRHLYQFLGKLLWEPNDRLQVHFRFDLMDKRDFEGVAFLPVTNTAPTQIGIAAGGAPSAGFYSTSSEFLTAPDKKSHEASNGAVLRVDYRFDPGTFSSISGWRHVSGLDFADLDTVSIRGQTAASPINTTNMYTQEFEFVSNAAGPWKYTGGMFLLHAREEYWFSVGGSLVFPPGSPSNLFISGDGISNTDSAAVYGEGSYAFKQWEFTLGGRYTHEKKKLPSNYSVLFLGNDSGGFAETILSSTLVDSDKEILYRRFTPKATLTYKPADKIMVYGTLSRGFKSGGFNLPAFGPVDSVKPESVTALELGWKTEFSRVRFNGALFYDKQSNLQVQVTDQVSGGTHVVNAARTKIYGAETDIDWIATDSLSVGVGAGYLHATYQDFVGDAYRPCNGTLADPTPAQAAQFAASCAAQGGLGLTLVSGNDFSGSKVANAPSFSGYLRLGYTLPTPERWGKIKASALASHQSEAVYNPEATLVEPARTLLNANLGWSSTDSHYRVSVYGTNLTNRQTSTTKTYQGTGGWYVPGRPREYGITFGVSY